MNKSVTRFTYIIQEQTFYYYILLLFGNLYLFVSFVLPHLGKYGEHAQSLLFGFSQFSFLKTNIYLLLLMLAIVGLSQLAPRFTFLSRPSLFTSQKKYRSIVLRLGISVMATALFFALRNNFLNSDAVTFAPKFMRDVPLLGAHVTHDEMWELYLHSRSWFYTNYYLGWSVELSYQLLSSLAGGIFVFLLLTWCLRNFVDKPLLGLLLCMSGGYIQLFFGDIENYTLTTTWIMSYLLASYLFLESEASIVWPSALLAIAITFHLLAGFLLPSLLFLYVIAWKRGHKRWLLYALGIFGLIIGLTLWFFHEHSLPISNLWYESHALGHGGNIASMLTIPSRSYYFALLNLAFLLVPAWILLFPLLLYKRFRFDKVNVHLLIASGSMAVFVLFWRAQLGVYQDWNLFAPAALPVSLFVCRNVLTIPSLPTKRLPISSLAWLFFFHSFSWIIANHSQ